MSIKSVSGRFQFLPPIQNCNCRLCHTPDAENVLKTINDIRQKNEQLLPGCGGDRDKAKVRIMPKLLRH
jgi:UDP-N-acetylmuramyl tripeptide synthase